MSKRAEVYSIFQEEKNRLAILLSQLRARLPAAEFCYLLKMQWGCDRLLRFSPPAEAWLIRWLASLKTEVDGLYHVLELGEFRRQDLTGLIRLYEELLATDASLPVDSMQTLARSSASPSS